MNEEARATWLAETWPQILAEAKANKGLILFGDEATCALWGSLGRTWALRGQQPEVKTSGKRKGYKLFGLVEYFTGSFSPGYHRPFSIGKLSGVSGVRSGSDQPAPHIIQDGARYHTSKAMQAFCPTSGAIDRLSTAILSDFNPIEFLWKKHRATHNRYFDSFAVLVETVDDALTYFAQAPEQILSLMGRYCETLGAVA